MNSKTPLHDLTDTIAHKDWRPDDGESWVRMERLEKMLASGQFDINKIDDEGHTALGRLIKKWMHMEPAQGATNGFTKKAVMSLVEAGADLFGQDRIVENLIERQQDSSWNQALLVSIIKGSLKKEINLGVETDDAGRTLLHHILKSAPTLLSRAMAPKTTTVEKNLMTVEDRDENTPGHCLFLPDSWLAKNIEAGFMQINVILPSIAHSANHEGKTPTDLLADIMENTPTKITVVEDGDIVRAAMKEIDRRAIDRSTALVDGSGRKGGMRL